MALHLVLSRSSGPSYKLRKKFNLSRISCYSESEEWSTTNLHPQIPKKLVEYAHYVMASGDGLLNYRFLGNFGTINVIWNPSTDKFQLIPDADSCNLPCFCPPRSCDDRLQGFIAWGLGFVPESHDYKHVRFISISDMYRADTSVHVAVYSSKTNSWKELPFPFHDDDVSPGDVSTCVKGFLYWKSHNDVIVSFDLSTDKFSTLFYPDGIPREGFGAHYYLLELDGSLCLVVESEFEKKAIKKLLTFWVHSSSSPWTRKTNLDVRLDAAVANIPLWLGKKSNGGQFLMLRGCDGALIEYDYTTRELKTIDQINYAHNDLLFISPYLETKNKNINPTCEFDGWTAHLRPHSKDRISQLPDDVILRILSLLSLKEAASTSVLSTRWSDLWRHTPNLNFHDAYLMKFKPQYINWVNSVVESHKALSLKEFSIAFPIDYSTRSTVIKWLEFAFSRRVEVLELNLFRRRFAFLQKFLRKSTVLKSANLRSVCLKCLKVSGRAIGLFLRDCPLLERLIIEHSVLKSDLEVCGTALKHLDIQYCKGGILIKGYAPNLTSLKIVSAPFSIIKDCFSHPNLAWATPQSADDPPLFPFISSQLKTLEFTLRFPKGYFGNKSSQVPTLRKLILTYLGGHGIRPVTSLLYAFPNLEEFEIKCFRRINTHKRHFIEGKRCLIERQGMDDVERFCHCYLRVFKFTWFNVDDGNHMELMSYILDNCVALQNITLDIYGVDSSSYVAAGEYAKHLQSTLPTRIQLIISFNNRQLV